MPPPSSLSGHVYVISLGGRGLGAAEQDDTDYVKTPAVGKSHCHSLMHGSRYDRLTSVSLTIVTSNLDLLKTQRIWLGSVQN
jgi:hypothetical protein